MEIQKIRKVKTPTRGTSRSAGIDFFVPDDSEVIMLYPRKSINIPSGIKVRIPEGYALVAFNKSGIAVKKNLIIGACVVDEDYQGEIHLHVMNVGDGIVQINPGDKLVQFILLPVYYDRIELVSTINYEESERGSGGFGSTGL